MSTDFEAPLSSRKKTRGKEKRLTMQMLFPLRRVCFSFVVFLPSGVFSLCEREREMNIVRNQRKKEIERPRSAFVSKVPPQSNLEIWGFTKATGSTYYSVTSSRTMSVLIREREG